jgi:hypothetical protein
MELVIGVFVALGLLVALWPWLLLGSAAVVVAYLMWAVIRRRRGHLD